jgi:hypothetical protein
MQIRLIILPPLQGFVPLGYLFPPGKTPGYCLADPAKGVTKGFAGGWREPGNSKTTLFCRLRRACAEFRIARFPISLSPLRLCVSTIPPARGSHAKAQRAQGFPKIPLEAFPYPLVGNDISTLLSVERKHFRTTCRGICGPNFYSGHQSIKMIATAPDS